MDFTITFYNSDLDDFTDIFYSSFLEPYTFKWFTDLYEVASGYSFENLSIVPENGFFIVDVVRL